MKYLEPKSVLVNSITVVSHQTIDDKDSSEVKERRVFLGFFIPEITSLDLEKALSSNDLWGRVLTMESFVEGGFRTISVIPRSITQGIVFETVDEFVQYLKMGLLYEDILEGYSMASGERSVQV